MLSALADRRYWWVGSELRIVRTFGCIRATATNAGVVETREQLEQLRTLGCTAAQGYFFSRPVEATPATILIATWREVALPA